MKKIFFSSAVIIAISAMVVGATTAYFSDTETHALNTIHAGTIDISLENTPIVTYSVENIRDLKPGMTQWIEFDVKNVGENPVVLRKRLTNFVLGTGEVSEPECTEQGGEWKDAGYCPVEAQDCSTEDLIFCDWGKARDRNNLIPYLTYDMVLGDENSFVLIPETRDVKLSDVRNLWVPIGTLEPGESLTVTQSYHLDEETGNWAQGDVLTFDINIHGEQRMGAGPTTNRGVVLENRTAADHYPIMDSLWGILTYDPSATSFNYTFRGFGLEEDSYDLVVDGFVLKSDLVPDSNGEVNVSGSHDFARDFEGVEVKLVPNTASEDYEDTLWGTNKINYNDTETNSS